MKIFFDNTISNTAFMTLKAKAEETREKNPIIIDEMACNVLDKITHTYGINDSELKKLKLKRKNRIGISLRAKYFDDLVSDYIESNSSPIVVHLGCGLDFRANRIKEHLANKSLFFYLDLNDVIKFRERFHKNKTNEFNISGDILNFNWVNEMDVSENESVIFIIEGLFIYLSEPQIKEVMYTLSKNYPGASIIFDVFSEAFSKSRGFSFGIKNDNQFENERLKLVSSKIITDFPYCNQLGLITNIHLKLSLNYRNSLRYLHYEVRNSKECHDPN